MLLILGIIFLIYVCLSVPEIPMLLTGLMLYPLVNPWPFLGLGILIFFINS